MSTPDPEPHYRDRRPAARRRGGGGWLLLFLLLLGAAALAFFDDLRAGAADTRGERIRLVALAVLLSFLVPALFFGNLSRNLRNLMVWMALCGILVAGYTLWQQGGLGTATLTAELAPRLAAPGGPPGVARFRANRRGDYVIRAAVDGVPVTFLVDTGASEVVLSRRDALRLGIDPARLRYTQRFQTANGTVFGAPVRLGEIAAGGVRMTGVRASVTDSDLGTSLLGMSFINRLAAFEMRNGTLTMRM